MINFFWEKIVKLKKPRRKDGGIGFIDQELHENVASCACRRPNYHEHEENYVSYVEQEQDDEDEEQENDFVVNDNDNDNDNEWGASAMNYWDDKFWDIGNKL